MDRESGSSTVLVIADTSPLETATVGGATGFIRAINSLGRSNWSFATPGASGESGRQTPQPASLLGSAIAGSRVPRRIQIALRAIRHWRRLKGFHVHYYHSNEAAIVLLTWPLRVLLGRPLAVIHQHGSASALSRPTFRLGRVRLVRRTYDALLRWAHRRADLIIAIDEACVVKNLAWGLPAERILKIPNAVDCNTFRRSATAREGLRQQLSIPASDRVVVHVGRLEAVKRQDLLIRGFANLLSNEGRCQLIIAGAGSLLPELQLLTSSLGIADRCHFLGAVSASELVPVYCAADCVALTSEIEGVPMVLLESFSCGTPVIATRVGGVSEITPPECGIVIDANPSVADVTTALRDCLARSWDPVAIAAYAQGYGVDRCCARLEQAFHEATLRRESR